ncbi:MAG: hypothetical protein GY724_14430 [Actinomycetia bacterium]|nr:hypothetical protein [Actinomycetes bacterium]MCP5032428.1 hypothetical protein [Actinomycetes bacterium]
MRSRILVAFTLSFALIVTGCGDGSSSDSEAADVESATDGSESSDDSASDPSSDGVETTEVETTEADTSETSEATADGSGGSSGGGADCLVGSWEASRDDFEEQITANLAAIPGIDPTLEAGQMTADFRADMTADFVTQATVSGDHPDLGRLEAIMDGLFVVDWVVEGDLLTYTTVSYTFDVAIDGFPFPDIPGPVEGDQASVNFTCSGDQLEIAPTNPAVRLPTQWTRVG